MRWEKARWKKKTYTGMSFSWGETKEFNNMVKCDLINVQDFNNKWSKNIQISRLIVVVIDTSDHLEWSLWKFMLNHCLMIIQLSKHSLW